MPIEFRCSQCQKLLQTPDETAGMQAKCPQCGAIQPIPGPSPSPTGAAPSASPGSPFAPGASSPGPSTASSSGGPADEANPYRSPADYAAAGGDWATQGYLQAYAASRVSAPATVLILIGGLGVIGCLIRLAASVLPFALPNMIQPGGGIGIEQLLAGGGGVVMSLVWLAFASVVILGGLKMKNLESHTWAMAGAIVAVIPCVSPCCLLGLPFGIWALMVLNDPQVRGAFRA